VTPVTHHGPPAILPASGIPARDARFVPGVLSLSDSPAEIFRLRPLVGSLALAALWFGLAWRSPTSTHHFAPLVIAAAWGFLVDVPTRQSARWAAAAGVVVAVVTLIGLALSDRLLGPTLWGSRPSWPELLGFAVLGGLLTVVRSRNAPGQAE